MNMPRERIYGPLSSIDDILNDPNECCVYMLFSYERCFLSII